MNHNLNAVYKITKYNDIRFSFHQGNNELRVLLGSLKSDIHQEGNRLIRQLKRRETLIARQEADSNMITALLQAHSEKRSK